MFVFGDVAGEYKTLLKLLSTIDDGNLICLGDPNDRGPDSNRVIDFLMRNSKLVQSNHSHMFLSYIKQSNNDISDYFKYEEGCFEMNGGWSTLKSYFTGTDIIIPQNHIEYLENSPMYIETDEFIFSHAPINHGSEAYFNIPFKDWDKYQIFDFIWNRTVPISKLSFLNNKINVFGHNSSLFPIVYIENEYGIEIQDNHHFKKVWENRIYDPIHAICLDTSQAKTLTGLDIETMTIIQQEYVR